MNKLWFFPIFPSVCSSRNERNAQKLAKSGRSCLCIVLPLIQPPILYTNKAYIPDVSIHCYYIKRNERKPCRFAGSREWMNKKLRKVWRSVTLNQRVAEGKATLGRRLELGFVTNVTRITGVSTTWNWWHGASKHVFFIIPTNQHIMPPSSTRLLK